MKGICTNERDDENISFRTDAYYEEQAGQEEIYLEESEEEVRMILEDPGPSPTRESTDLDRLEAAKVRINGDCNQFPPSNGTVEGILNES
jgi:hypothetical protein